MTAAEILAIKEPEQIFSSDLVAAKNEFRDLVRKWHPDHNPNLVANDILAHINYLYQEARKRLLEGTWQTPGCLTLNSTDNKIYKIHYHIMFPFELGEAAIGKSIIAFLVDDPYKDLFKDGLCWMESRNYSYANDKMRDEITRYLPKRKGVFALREAKNVIVVEKDPGLVRLRDLVEYCNGKLDPKHVAWIISSLYNLLCYFNFARIVHGDISLDTYFVDPEKHSGALLGGWWYARREGERLVALPSRTVDNMPPDLWASKKADCRTDLSLVRLLGREMLGDASGARLRTDHNIPRALSEWLCYGTSGSALRDYEIWQRVVIPAAFGGRYFTKLDARPENIYTN